MDYTIEWVPVNDDAGLRRAAKFLKEHGLKAEATSRTEVIFNQGFLEVRGIPNVNRLADFTLVAKRERDLIGVVRLASPGSFIGQLAKAIPSDPDLYKGYIDSALDRINLAQLAVKEEARGSGVGQSLVQAALNLARRHGYEVVAGQIDEKAGDNEKLTDFYRRCGFTVVPHSEFPPQMTGTGHRVMTPYSGNKFYIEL